MQDSQRVGNLPHRLFQRAESAGGGGGVMQQIDRLSTSLLGCSAMDLGRKQIGLIVASPSPPFSIAEAGVY